MATSKETYVAGSQLAKSYRSWIRGTVYRDAENQVVVDGVVTLLRRHSIHGTICSNCDNDDPNQCQVSDVDKLAFITEVQCLVCGESLPTVCRRSKYYLENIDDPSVLQRGDHVGWYRALAYWHHGIVTRQGADSVYVVGYTVSNPDHPGATVTEKEYGHRSMVSLMRGNVYRIVYDDCFTNEYTALRAQRTLGEQKYDFFEQNCEHSTYWSKTGLHGSNQIESGFVSLGMVMLGILLRVAVLSVLWLLQICRLTQTGTESGEGLWVERGVNIAYVTIVVTIFSAYSIYKGFDRMKSRAPALRREPYDDPMESCRKHCANWFYDCCCQREPKCSRITCSICFVCCCCCSLFDVVWSFCVMKLRVCSVPCCGRPIVPATSLVVRTVVKEMIAASGAFLVVWFMHDIVAYFEARGVMVSSNPSVNSAAIVIVAILVASIVAYPVGDLLSRWVQGMIECCCCPCSQPPSPSKHVMHQCVNPPCPVHDEIMTIPTPYEEEEFHMTNIAIDDTENQCSTVILL